MNTLPDSLRPMARTAFETCHAFCFPATYRAVVPAACVLARCIDRGEGNLLRPLPPEIQVLKLGAPDEH